MKILDDIAALDKKISEIYLSAEVYKKERQKLIDKLKALCTHSETYDDGYDKPDSYGGENWISRIRCKICGIDMEDKKKR